MSETLTPVEAAKLASNIERFAQIEHSHKNNKDTSVILRLAVGLRRKLINYRDKKGA